MKVYVETMIQENPAWLELTAVQQGRLYFMDKNLYNLKPNHRWGEAYEIRDGVVTEVRHGA